MLDRLTIERLSSNTKLLFLSRVEAYRYFESRENWRNRPASRIRRMGKAGDIYNAVLRTGLNHAMLSAPKIRDTRLQFSGGAHRG